MLYSFGIKPLLLFQCSYLQFSFIILWRNIGGWKSLLSQIDQTPKGAADWISESCLRPERLKGQPQAKVKWCHMLSGRCYLSHLGLSSQAFQYQ